MSDKPFVAEACPPMSHASASNGLSDIETHIKNAPCNRPLKKRMTICSIKKGKLFHTKLFSEWIIEMDYLECTTDGGVGCISDETSL
jgi:hypothetical protein